MVREIGCDLQFHLFYIMTRYFRIQSRITLCNEGEECMDVKINKIIGIYFKNNTIIYICYVFLGETIALKA